jgi:hypothetical protein
MKLKRFKWWIASAIIQAWYIIDGVMDWVEEAHREAFNPLL